MGNTVAKDGPKLTNTVNCEQAILDRSGGKNVFLSQPQISFCDEVQKLLLTDDATKGIFLLATSGAGKSTVLADLSLKLREKERVLVFSIFVGATDASTSAFRFLQELVSVVVRQCKTLFAQNRRVVDDIEEIQGECADDLQALTGNFQKIIDVLGESLAKGFKNPSDAKWKTAAPVHEKCRILLVFDAVNELDLESRNLTWLPIVLPANCKYLFSSIAPSTMKFDSTEEIDDTEIGGLSADDRELFSVFRTVKQRWPFVRVVSLGALEEKDRKDMLGFMLKTAAGSTDECGADRRKFLESPALAELVLKHKADADLKSPLYLRLLVREIVCCVLHTDSVSASDEGASLKGMTSFLTDTVPNTIPSLFDHVLKDIDGLIADKVTTKFCHSESATRLLFGSIFATDGGLHVEQLLSLVPLKLSEHQQARVLSLVKMGETSSVGFIHMQARDAVQRYFKLWRDSTELRSIHTILADYFMDYYTSTYMNEKALTASAFLQQTLSRLPLHLRLSSEVKHSKTILQDMFCGGDGFKFACRKCDNGQVGEFFLEFRHYLVAKKYDFVLDWNEFYQGNRHVFRMFVPQPGDNATTAASSGSEASTSASDSRSGIKHSISMAQVLFQQAQNTRDDSDVLKNLAAAKREGCVVLWRNKAQKKPSIESTIQLGRGIWIWVSAQQFYLQKDKQRPFLIALGCSDRLIHIIDLQSGDETRTLLGHTGEISHVVFLENLLISVAPTKPYKKDNEVLVWNTKTGKKNQHLSAKGACTSCRLSDDGNYFAIRSNDFLTVYAVQGSVECGDCTLEEAVLQDLSSHQGGSGGCDWIMVGGSYWLTTGAGGNGFSFQYLPEKKSIEQKDALEGHTSRVVDIRFLAGSETPIYLASCSMDRDMRVWSSSGEGKGVCVHTVKLPHGPEADLTALGVDCFAKNAWKIFTCSDDKTLNVYEFRAPDGGRSLKTPEVKAGSGSGKAPAVKAPAGRGSNAGRSGGSGVTCSKVAILDGNSSAVKQAEIFSLSTGKRCLACSEDGVARLYDIQIAESSFRISAQIRGGTSSSSSSSGGDKKDGGVKLPPINAKAGAKAAPAKAAAPKNPNVFDASTADPTAPAGHQPNALTACAIIKNDSACYVATADVCGYVGLYSEQCLSNKDILWRVLLKSKNPTNMQAVVSLASMTDVLPKGAAGPSGIVSRSIIFAAMFQVVHILAVKSGQTLISCGFPDWINYIYADTHIAVVGGDSFTLAWQTGDILGNTLKDSESGTSGAKLAWEEPSANFLDKNAVVKGMSILTCGAERVDSKSPFLIATGSNDDTCRIWSSKTRSVLVKFISDSWVSALCFCSADVKSVCIAGGSQSGTLYIWKVDTENLMKSEDKDLSEAALVIKGNVEKTVGVGTNLVAWLGRFVNTNYIAASTASKMIYVFNLSNGSIARVGYFPAQGSFGSADGVGGQASITSDGMLCIGDYSGRLYKLNVEFEKT